MAAYRVYFVDEDNAGRIFLALLEKIAHTAGAHADEHFDEIRAGNREKGNIRLAGDSARQQSLSGSRRADQEHALRNAPAELLEFLRVFQEINNLVEFFLGFVNSRNVFEGGLFLLRG